MDVGDIQNNIYILRSRFYTTIAQLEQIWNLSKQGRKAYRKTIMHIMVFFCDVETCTFQKENCGQKLQEYDEYPNHI